MTRVDLVDGLSAIKRKPNHQMLEGEMFRFLSNRRAINKYKDRLFKLQFTSVVLKNQPNLDPATLAHQFTRLEIEQAKASDDPEGYLSDMCIELERKVRTQKTFVDIVVDLFEASGSSVLNPDGTITLDSGHVKVAIPTIREFGNPKSEPFKSTFKNWLSASLSHEGSIKHSDTRKAMEEEMRAMRTFLVGDVNEQEVRATAIQMVLSDEQVEQAMASALAP